MARQRAHKGRVFEHLTLANKQLSHVSRSLTCLVGAGVESDTGLTDCCIVEDSVIVSVNIMGELTIIYIAWGNGSKTISLEGFQDAYEYFSQAQRRRDWDSIALGICRSAS